MYMWKPAAIFSNYDSAEEYVEKSLLKAPGFVTKYRQKSLLWGAKDHKIQTLASYLPINPEL